MHLVWGCLEALDSVENDLSRLCRVTPPADLHPLTGLEIFVVLKEMADALEPVLGHLADIVHVTITVEHLVDGNGQQIFWSEPASSCIIITPTGRQRMTEPGTSGSGRITSTSAGSPEVVPLFRTVG